MRWSLTLPASLLLGIALQAHGSSALDNDFSAYPEDSQQCLTDAANDTPCSGNTGNEINRCLCSNKGNFIYNTAECVAKKSPSDLNAVYDTMENNCAGTGVTIAVSKQAFLSQAAAATETTSSPTPTSTSSSSPSSTDSPEASPTTSNSPSETSSSSSNSALSQGAKIGLGVGIGFGAVALGLLGWFVFMYSRRRKLNASANPNSPNQHDVELSPNGGAYSQHNGSSLYHPSPLSPPPEFAQHNAQFAGVAELSPANAHTGWKELPADYYGGDKKDGADKGGVGVGHNYKRSSGVPLLAELDDGSSPAPVELPGSEVYNDAGSVRTPTHDDDSARRPESGYRDQGLGNSHGAG